MRFYQILFGTIILLLIIGSCQSPHNYDLAIENVKVFDVHSRKVLERKTILIEDSRIESIIDFGKEFKAEQIIEGNSRLVTPGFIDTHIHLTDIYGDYENTPKYLAADSIDYYRSLLTGTYMNYGITTVAVINKANELNMHL